MLEKTLCAADGKAVNSEAAVMVGIAARSVAWVGMRALMP